MKRERILFILGIWVAVLSYLGFPLSWKNILFTISGLILVYYSYAMHKENRVENTKVKTFDNFSENDNFDATKNF